MTSLRSPATGPGVYVLSVLVVILAVASAWWAAAVQPDTRPAITSALDALPARTNVVGFTDWKQIRTTLDLGTVDTAGERDELQYAPATRDLTTRSVIGRNIEEMHDVLGWSPAELDWEVYGQHPRGAATIARTSGSVDFGDVRARLRKAGYQQDRNIWSSTRQTGLTEISAHIAVVPRQRLVVMSDDKTQIPLVLDVIDGRARSLAGSHAAANTAHALAGSDSIILQGGELGCDTTAIAGDADQERQARTAVRRAGGLETYGFSGRGIVDHGGSGFSAQRLVFAMTFDSAAVASQQTEVRSRLAAGPFIGRIGRVEETLRLRSAAHEGQTVRLEFAHDPETDVFMTGRGPILFAAC